MSYEASPLGRTFETDAEMRARRGRENEREADRLRIVSLTTVGGEPAQTAKATEVSQHQVNLNRAEDETLRRDQQTPATEADSHQ